MRIIRVRESMEKHRPWFNHPENPERVAKITTTLLSSNIQFTDVSIENTPEIEAFKLASRIHVKGYLDYLVKLSQYDKSIIDEDTYFTRDTLKLALSTLHYTYEYTAKKGSYFLVSRPPGHHVGREGKTRGVSTQGFCILNNAVGGVEGFRDQGFGRIMVIDFDSHYGNGTMEILYRDRVLQVDIHQDPRTLYPYRGYPEELGEGDGYGYKVNIILPPGGGDDLFTDLIELLTLFVEKYTPEALVVSAGFDGFLDDGLSDLRLTEKSYYELGLFIRNLDIPVIAVLEGGYDTGLEKGLLAFTEGSMGLVKKYIAKTTTPPTLYQRTLSDTRRLLEKVFKRIT